MDSRNPSRPSGSSDVGHSPGWAGWIVGPVFLLLAALFVRGPDLAHVPGAEGEEYDASVLSTHPLREILGHPPLIEIGGYELTCMDCHRIFPAAEETPESLQQHEHIVMEHGVNDECRSCHHTVERNKLVLRSGAAIPFTEASLLCGQCHGPTYRDWVRGAHGRTNGYWDESRGKAYRLQCTECHDPHAPRRPAMQPLQPLPPPVTFRMGELKPHTEAVLEDESDPLRRALYRLDGEGDGSTHEKPHDESHEESDE
jgi:hypothetical protein